MSHIYINTKQAEESRIVVVEDGVLTGFEQEIAGRENRKGDIYKAVVVRIENGLDAAFVDFGDDKNGFLPLKDVAPNLPGATGPDGTLNEGDSILVQIKKDYSGGKGAGLTTFISLAGCYLVLNPVRGGRTHVSRRSNPNTREQVRRLVAELPVPQNMSVIVRTAGLKQDAAALAWDLESYLLKLWGMIDEAGRSEKGPALIYRENNILMRAARDYFNPHTDTITCDDSESFEELRNFIALVHPDKTDRLNFHEAEGPMISDALEAKIDEIFEREVQTPSGARLVFDSTEAMVTVDVNSARMKGADNIEETALHANLEAAEAVSRHLRLRDLAGLIVVDFIDMDDEKNRKQVENKLRECFKKDRAQLRHTGISQLGLVEISRQRLARSVEEGHSLSCARCGGTGRVRRTESLASSLLRRARVTAVQAQVNALLLQAPPEVAVYLLNEKRVALRRLEDSSECEILVLPDERLHPHEWRLRVLREGSAGNSDDLLRNNKRSEMPESVDDRLRPNKSAPQPVLKRVMPEKPAPKLDEAQPSPANGGGGDSGGGSFFSWLAGLFGASSSQPQNKKQRPQRHSANADGNRRGRGRGRNRGGEREGGRRARSNGRRDSRDMRESRDRGERDNRDHRGERDRDNNREGGHRRRQQSRNNGSRHQQQHSRRAQQTTSQAEVNNNNAEHSAPVVKETASAPTTPAPKETPPPQQQQSASAPVETSPPPPPPPPPPPLPKISGNLKMVETESAKPAPAAAAQKQSVVLGDLPPPTPRAPSEQREEMRQVETARE